MAYDDELDALRRLTTELQATDAAHQIAVGELHSYVDRLAREEAHEAPILADLHLAHHQCENQTHAFLETVLRQLEGRIAASVAAAVTITASSEKIDESDDPMKEDNPCVASSSDVAL